MIETVPHKPVLSAHFRDREPSAIRVASIKFAQRKDGTQAVNVAIGNVSLPMHPAMIARMKRLDAPESPFHDGVVGYTATVGTDVTRQTFLHLIAASGASVEGLHCQITDGGSQAMELAILGCCGPAGTDERPLMLIDPAYTNYNAFASRLGRATVSIKRTLQDDGKFSLPSLDEIERLIVDRKPGAVVVIPYDNPTGHFYDQATLNDLARICVRNNIWIISDEAYRELHYVDHPATSVWRVSENEVPGITGRRISIESASKVWNACGLRIGALVTDNLEFHVQSVAENTASLCPNAIGQYIFGALAGESHEALQAWFSRQREYYDGMLQTVTDGVRAALPGVIVSSPDSSLYSIVDVRNLVGPEFQAMDFVMFCATRGAVEIDGQRLTLLTAPMAGFYSCEEGEPNPGRTQMRIAYVEAPDRMALVPRLLGELFRQYHQT